MTDEVRYAEEGHVATVTLNRPDRLNAFNQAQCLDLIAALRGAAQSEAVRAVVLCGAGRGFSAGADLKDSSAQNATPTRESIRMQLEDEYNPGILAIQRMPKPVIAAVTGFAAGIGVAYALACDLIVMGEHAFLQLPFANIALIPDGGACWQLVQRLGYARAFEIAVEGERISAARCIEWGLANRIVHDAEVLREARGWAARLAAKAPRAIAGTKQAMRFAESAASMVEVMQLEVRQQQACATSEDFHEGVRAFLEKRAAKFTGR